MPRSCVSWRSERVRRSFCGGPEINPRTCARYLGLGHAVQMQIPPVGHVRQQVAVVEGVAVQVHTLGLDQQDDIWGGGSHVSEKGNQTLGDTLKLTIQQVFRKLLQNVFHTQWISSIESIKQVFGQFGASFIISAVDS